MIGSTNPTQLELGELFRGLMDNLTNHSLFWRTVLFVKPKTLADLEQDVAVKI